MWTAGQSDAVRPPPVSRAPLLSDRERAIIALIGQGYRNRQIATTLNLSEQTVKNKLTVIFEKLQISGRVRLAVYALENSIE